MRRTLLITVFLYIFFLPFCALAAPNLDFVGSFEASRPMFVTTDEAGRIYVTQKENIRVLDSKGNAIKEMGGDVLKSPSGIDYYQGKLYVTDTSLNQVMILSTDGGLLEFFGGRGSDPGEFNKPMGIFVNSGNIYVADKGNNRVQIFGPNGVYMGSIGEAGAEGVALEGPTDVALDASGRVFVADGSASGLKLYSRTGKFLGYVDSVVAPYSMAMVEDGLYASDPGSYKVVRCDTEGKARYSFGSQGNGRAQFKSMGGMHADGDGRFYMADIKRDMIHVFIPEALKESPEVAGAPPLTSVRWVKNFEVNTINISWDPRGKILYAVDKDNNSVLAIREGRSPWPISLEGTKPVATTVDSAGNLWVVDQGKDQLIKMDSQGTVIYKVGSRGSGEGKLSNPADMAVSGDGIIYVADKNNGRIEVFNTDGVFLKVLKSGPPIAKPIAVALSDKGLYVLDDEMKRLVLLSEEGQVLKEIGGMGEGKGMFDEPVDVAVTKDEVFVLDAGKKRVHVFDHEGNFTREFGSGAQGRGGFTKPSSLAFMDGIRLMVADAAVPMVQVLANIYTPPKPSDFKARSGMHEVELSWTPSSESFVTGYRIYRSEQGPGKGFELLKEISMGSHRSYTDTDVEPGRRYYYRVSAVADEGNESVMSSVSQAAPDKYRVLPPADAKATADERTATLSWSSEGESYLSHFVIYRIADEKSYKLAETKDTTYVDTELIPNSIYTYAVTSVSTDGLESSMVSMEATTKAVQGPPLEMQVIEMHDVFSNAYKIYENEGIGKIKLTNNTGFAIPKIKVAFNMKEFEDFPSETYVEDLRPGESREVAVRAVFNNKILEVTEDTPVQTEIKVSYYKGQELFTFAENHTVFVYEKHRMTWDEPGRIGTFITSKEAVLLEFARSVVTQYREADSPLVLAGMVFDAMGVLGVTYLPDPNNPYQETSGKTDFVDYSQYPRETLKRKSGDCDDLVSLYSAALESLGIETRIVLYTGHMLMMFSTGKESTSPEGIEDLYVVRDGKLWVPVELTLVGNSFIKAWEKGVENYRTWWEGPGLYLLDPRKAWQRFKPASLRSLDWRVEFISRDRIEQAYDEYRVLTKMNLSHKTSRFVKALKEDPGDVDAMHQLAIIYAQAGQPEEAVKLFEKAMTLRPKDAALINDVGNVYFLEGDYANACQFYDTASKFDNNDAHILVNLARCYMKLDKKEEAKKAFGAAYILEPEVSKLYRALALDLLGEI